MKDHLEEKGVDLHVAVDECVKGFRRTFWVCTGIYALGILCLVLLKYLAPWD